MLSNINIDNHSIVSLSLAVEYISPQGKHRDNIHVEKFNCWRDADLLPAQMQQALMGQQRGYRQAFSFSASELIETEIRPVLFQVDRKDFHPATGLNKHMLPQSGRFYPAGWFSGDASAIAGGLTSDSMSAVRLVHLDEHAMQLDLVHPLFGHELNIVIKVLNVYNSFEERGGRCNDCIRDLLNGPGMQLRYENTPTDFFSDEPFSRDIEDNDALFYEMPRMVNHLDETAMQQVRSLYSELIPENACILDLMSSVNSHLPADIKARHVTGLGLNLEELQANPVLNANVVYDLNQNPALPFDDASVDAVLCTVSVEYLTKPLDVFAEVARVLRPGGIFICTFSNRWYPGKAIRLWPDLHEFERIGLVSEYFMDSDNFEHINTRSIRGLPRPENDRHALPCSDPVYAVWATKKR